MILLFDALLERLATLFKVNNFWVQNSLKGRRADHLLSFFALALICFFNNYHKPSLTALPEVTPPDQDVGGGKNYFTLYYALQLLIGVWVVIRVVVLVAIWISEPIKVEI